MVADPNAASITVAVRVRPFTIREAAQLTRNDEGTVFLGDGSLAAAPPKLQRGGIRPVIKVVDDRCLVFDPPEDNPVHRFGRSVVPNGKKVKDQTFMFDRIFDENATQNDVYEGTTKQLLDSVLDGYNATVFAYGATGCGKTHTITGTAQHPGIIFMTMQELFEKINERSQDKTTEITLSYLEIYNETIRDLLIPGGSKQGLMLREDSNQAVSVAGLTSHHPKNVQEVMDMIVQGNEWRTVSPTEANATSSRSHAVLQINVAQKDRNADVNEPHTMATLSIIDLAGSERASATKNRGERLLEGANINKSLLALGSCINALCDPRKTNHVPYRNSKLTRLLKFSLGGNCKTVMIVCVSPSSVHFDETQNTLRYANRAKNIQTKVTRNVFNVNRHVKDFLVKIDEQIALINELKAQQKDAEKIFYAKFRKQLEKRDSVAREGIQRIRVAYDNSANDRRDKINNMKKLRAFERRIGLLSAWIASFDTVCDQRGDEDSMPASLVAIRKTAQGILVELEHSRHHIHQKLEHTNWERSIDTALHHSIKQLPGGDADAAEIYTLTREAELLKANFGRDANREVLEMDKAGDAAMVQVLLTAQFDILASLEDTLEMNEEDAVAHAKRIINRLLEAGFTAASHVVKPDGAMIPVEKFSPSKRGTPKRKKAVLNNLNNTSPVRQPAFAPPADTAPQPHVSPLKVSPRRKKTGAPRSPRKGVSFSPVKRKSEAKRAVRWRDDETEQGTLADFEKTPKKFETTPEHNSPGKRSPKMPPLPSYLRTASPNPDKSPTLELEGSSSIPPAKPNRFQAGFLSKGRVSSIGSGSPTMPVPTMSLPLGLSPSSDNGGRVSPLRALDVQRSSNLSPPAFRSRIARASPPPRTSLSGSVSADENNPPPSYNASGSESESPSIDPRKLRSAMNSMKKVRGEHRRVSSIGGSTGGNARRISSVSSISTNHRASLSFSGPLASNSNGISRQRRASAERRLSPPITCSPPDVKSDRAFTAGQARRMNLGGSLRLEGGSPQAPPSRMVSADFKNRRITIGSLAATGKIEKSHAPRPSVAGWR
ncbi:kinesin motor domain-containing protein [Colletotrichum graminicola]|uniref:Kinesin motor domain-containing protein n=1 Tax=Colletotrichum graminicola (strain M1.001 / M2 / FGSC 10212) TaxID=645133 RepID=E3QS15_COLGM|nr:kinesin motor domain-containing protein [Colletotrichum graminicola M1.001]EFQ33653.1 kinesin motor domain-containing protein [Colletotrichum graminicola M1.001]WDK10772.1 kinesin motor domain-containing protein [Colletotrichum graminicola]